MVETHTPLTDRRGEEKRWAEWRGWLVQRKTGGAKGPCRAAAGGLGGLKGGRARAAKRRLSRGRRLTGRRPPLDDRSRIDTP